MISMAKKGMNRASAWITAISLLIVIALTIVGFMWAKNNKDSAYEDLKKYQEEMIQLLTDKEGDYDEQSIVLYGTNEREAKKLAGLLDARLRITKNGEFATLTLPEGTTILDVISNDENLEYIKSISADWSAKISDALEYERIPESPDYNVGDELFEYQSYFGYLNLDNVWEEYKGVGVTVAVIDSGIDTDHPEFANRISEYSYNASEDKIVKDYVLENGSYDWSLIEDEQGHGTAVAGTIGAAMDNKGTVGVAPEVTIIVIKAECDENGTFKRGSDLVFGLYYAIERDVDVVNMSFGGRSNIYADAARLGRDSDIIMIASAGNDSTSALHYPASDENVIGVGALADGSWDLASYSNFGDNVNIVAPGTTFTTVMGGGYNTMTGTSFSAPVVSGIIALLKDNYAYKYTTNEKIVELLYASAYDLGDLGPDFYFGYGAIDAGALIYGRRGNVTFDYLTDEIDETSQIFILGNPLQDIPEPERLYCVFEGWYYDIECSEPLDLYRDAFVGDLTLYAKWINEDDGVPYTYVILDDGTVEIRSYTGHRKYITVPSMIEGRVVSSIGDRAFSGQTRLREIQLPETIKHIGISAFENCTNIISMKIPDSVVEIEASAFKNNTRMSSIIFGASSSLKVVGDFAFENCARLTRVDLPKSLESINGSAFRGAYSLTKINVDSANGKLTSADGVLFDKAKTILVAYPAGISSSYTLPDSTVTVGQYAFSCSSSSSVGLNKAVKIEKNAFEKSAIREVVIPNSVTSLGASVFGNCICLSKVTIGTGVTTIPGYAFLGDVSLSSISIPAGVEKIDSYAFAQSGLTSVSIAQNSKLAEIGSVAFANTFIEKINLPKSLVTIDSGAFASCYSLSEVTFAQGSALATIGEDAFADSISLKSVSLPSGLVTLGDGAFSNGGMTGTVVIPASVTYFGAGAFASCHSLTDIDVSASNTAYVDYNGVVYTKNGSTLVAYPAGKPGESYTVRSGAKTIGKSAFEGSDNLVTITVCEGVTEILGKGFYRCSNMTEYTLPTTLKDIGEYAFSENISLQVIEIPKNVITVARYAFALDKNLHTISIAEDSVMSRIGYAAFAHTGIYSFTVPSNVSTIAQYAFMGSDDLRSITFAENSKLESVSAYMFLGAENVISIVFESGSALSSVQAHGFEGLRSLSYLDFGGANLDNVDNYAFRYCSSLSSITLPDTVTNIGRFAFYNCSALSEINIPEATEHIGSYAFFGNNECNLYFASEQLPAQLDENWDNGVQGYYTGVVEVITSGDWKYANKTNGNIAIIKYLGNSSVIDLTKLNLGGKIETIGGHAFAESDITAITLPNTLTEIQRYAFAHTEKLEGIIIPAGVKHIGSYAFVNSGIKSLTLNSGVEVIERYAFAFTDNLTSVKLPSTLRSLGSYVFYNSGLTSLTFNSGFSMTEIPESAFASTSISSVVIPDSVTRIRASAFRDNTKLKSVTLGNGEDLRIDSNAFYNTAIQSLYIPKTVRYIGEYAFIGLENLNSYQIDSANPYYTVVDGVLYNKDKTKLVAFPAGRTGSFEVPAFVETIGFGAFENSHLSSISFAKDINLLTIGWRAFFGAESITSINLPESLISIDYYAFAGCKNLTTVSFADNNNIKGIYEGAFFGCNKLENITIPDSIVEISEYAFYGCRALDKMPISDTAKIKGIYDYAFAYTGITELTIPGSVMDIGSYAFRGAPLKEVYIPDDNGKELIIGIGAFADCTVIEEITLPFIGESFGATDRNWFGYIFGAGGYEANASYVPKSLKRVVIHEGITSIPESAFYMLSDIESISVPHSVTYVGEWAFGFTKATYELTNVISGSFTFGNTYGTGLSGHLTIADGVTAIGYEMFNDCTNLTSVTIPDSVKMIGGNAFSDTGIRSIDLPESLENIGYMAFSGCKYLTNLVIPDSVTTIEDFAFIDCNALTSVTLGKSVKNIGEYAFIRYEHNTRYLYKIINRSSLDLTFGSESHGGVAMHAQIIVNSDGSYTYRDQQSQTTYVETDDGFVFELTDVKYTLKSYTGNEETITLPRDINGSSYSINNFKGGINIIIPDSITEIDEEAFFDNEGVKSFVIPGSVTSIGARAFSQCTSLTEIYIPDSVTQIGSQAFRFCLSLESANIPSGVTDISGIYNDCISLKSITIPDNITCISDSAFMGCDSLESITIPSTVTKIGSYAFYHCDSLAEIIYEGECNVAMIDQSAFGWCTSLKEFIIPDSVTHIGGSAFVDCSGLTEITIHDGIQDIGNGAFSRSKISEVVISADHPYFTLHDGVLYTKNYKNVIFVLDGVTEVTLPDGMTAVSKSAFSGCTTLVSVTIPESVTSIGIEAFMNCSSLESITIPNTVKYIGDSAFFYCTSLKSIVIPDTVKTIGYGAFWGCKSLESVKLPSGITKIDGLVFAECESLKEINIPNGVTNIGSGAFQFCKSLAKIVLPDSVTTIENAFGWCESLQSINIPDGVTRLQGGTFSECISLNEVVFGENSRLTTIDEWAFNGCQSLFCITIPKNVTSIGEDNFSSVLEIINKSSLSFTFGSEEYGSIALNAYVIEDASGKRTYREYLDGSSFVETADGFFYRLKDGEYTLIAYTGKNDTITLPTDINGSDYKLENFKGGVNVIIPDGFTTISSYAFSGNLTIKSITIPSSVRTIEDGAFSGCRSLTDPVIPNSVTYIGAVAFHDCRSIKSITIPDSVTEIGGWAFSSCSSLESITIPDSVKTIGNAIVGYTAFYENAENWRDGALYIGNHLIKVREDVTSFTFDSNLIAIASDVFDNCYLLTEVTLGGDHPGILWGLTNLETLVIDKLPTQHGITEYFGGIDGAPITLSKVILKQGCQVESYGLFFGISNVTIFVEDAKEECPWDEGYNGWNNDNRVVYGGNWYYVSYLDEDGKLIATHYYKYSEVVRPPYIYSYRDAGKQYSFMGWDNDGDGVADGFPASINKNYQLRAVFEESYAKYNVYFMDDDGKTILYSYELNYGDSIPTPQDPTKDGFIFSGWSRIPSTVTEDVVIKARWHQHNYVAVSVASTCAERGYTGTICKGCGDTKIESYLDLADHSYTWTTVEPTCTEKGYTGYNCQICGDVKTDNYVDLLPHSFVFYSQQAPTCSEQGYTVYKCGACDEMKNDDFVDPTGKHSFTNYVQDGDKMIAKCNNCDATDTVSIEGGSVVETFRNAVNGITTDGGLGDTYEQLRRAMTVYNMLTSEQKEEVQEEYNLLLNMINDYNSKANTVNGEAEKANALIFSVISSSFGFLSAFWFLIKKKFIL